MKKVPPLSALPLACSDRGAMATGSTNFLLGPPAKIILREATECCHFYGATRVAAEACTANSAAFDRQHIPPASNSNGRHEQTLHGTNCPNFRRPTASARLVGDTRCVFDWIFFALPCVHFFFVYKSTIANSAAVVSVTLKINKVRHPSALPHPLLIQQHHRTLPDRVNLERCF